jgi:predicted sugar kinase
MLYVTQSLDLTSLVPFPPHAGGLGSGTVISLESAKALDFLICSSKHGKRTASLSELASSSGETTKSGYSKVGILIFIVCPTFTIVK